MRYIVLLFIGVFGLTACESLSKRHATRAILFSQQPQENPSIPQNEPVTDPAPTDISFVLPKSNSSLISGNPVFIHNNTKFSIRVDEINPGWIYKGKPTENSNSSNQSPQPTSKHPQSTTSKPYHPISLEHYDHFRGHELWLLTTISSLNTNDPLETKSKRYFKATNVKFDAQSYALVPLDADERYIFTHESDSSYRVKFQLFKVDQFALKKELAKISQNPGVVGAGQALLETLKNTAGALAGDVIQSLWDEKSSETLALERFLLSIGATEEFHGDIVVLRDGDFQNRPTENVFTPAQLKAIQNFHKNLKAEDYEFAKPYVESNYLLLDFFKGLDAEVNYSFKKYDSDSKYNYFGEYLSGVTISGNTIDVIGPYQNPAELNRYSYIKLTVLESFSAKNYIDENGKIRPMQIPDTYQEKISALNKLAEENESQLKGRITALEADLAFCPDQPCKNEKNAEIANIKNKLSTLQKSPELKAAIDKYNTVTKLDDWKAHMARQAD